MANEITVVGARGRMVDLLFFYPLDTPAQNSAGENVVRTPSGNLSAVALNALSIDQVDQLDSGTAMFAVVRPELPISMTAPEMLAFARGLYATHGLYVISNYNDEYKFQARVGQQFDSG
ncbi:MAG: hypothetical protein KAJ19_24935, partial [Gammaproteobacteria bacterium]|nr:hypothetical protein [Gammaproteobacteria bacterium]